MLLKTYRAPDLASALTQARSELGPSALVLATREVRGRLGLESVEVTVAADRPTRTPAAGPSGPQGDGSRRLAAEIERLNRRLREPAPSRPAPGGVEATDIATHPVLREAVRALIASGLSEDLATRFARMAGGGLDARAGAGDVAVAAERAISSLVRFSPAPLGARCLLVVGPPGAGKTSTVAKLAARIVQRSGRPLCIADADPEGVSSKWSGSVARWLGAGFRRVGGAEELRTAVKTADGEALFVVDTPGVGESDEQPRRYLDELRRALPAARMAVLLPAGLHREEASRVLERFGALAPTCAAFSRVDDGRRIGDLVSALAPTRIPLSFMTHGREASDFEDATPRRLAARMFRAGLRPPVPVPAPHFGQSGQEEDRR